MLRLTGVGGRSLTLVLSELSLRRQNRALRFWFRVFLSVRFTVAGHRLFWRSDHLRPGALQVAQVNGLLGTYVRTTHRDYTRNRIKNRSNSAADFRAFYPPPLTETGFRQNV